MKTNIATLQNQIVSVLYDHVRRSWIIYPGSSPSLSGADQIYTTTDRHFYLGAPHFYRIPTPSSLQITCHTAMISYAAGVFSLFFPPFKPDPPLHDWVPTRVSRQTHRISIPQYNPNRNPKNLLVSLRSAEVAFFHPLAINCLVYEPTTF